MNNAASYLRQTEIAVSGLFGLLRQYKFDKLKGIAELLSSKGQRISDLEVFKERDSAVNTALDVIAGSILQIAYVAIRDYAQPVTKSARALHFESEIQRLIRENPEQAKINKFELPAQFCVGRDLGDLPIGMVIYAARNQYAHHSEKDLKVTNAIVFNYLNSCWPNPPNDLSFDIYNKRAWYTYPVLAALHWIDTEKRGAYEKYKSDISDALGIAF